MRQCKGCVFKSKSKKCEIKDISINEIDYNNCWFFRKQDIGEQNEHDEFDCYDDYEGAYEYS